MNDSEIQIISQYLDLIGDEDSLIEDFIVIDGIVRFKDECSMGELYPDSYNEFGFPM